uniref:Uncharacterized protein n=1 Tax=Romanomermis culicivorax TaxID=13658 RepID=A0A915IW28_ROMCU
MLKHELAVVPQFGEEPTAFLSKNTYIIYPDYEYATPWEQHVQYNLPPMPWITTPTNSSRASSQSSKIALKLSMPPMSSANPAASNLDAPDYSQPTSTANMVMPSKEVTAATLIVSPDILCWVATDNAAEEPCYKYSSLCQIDNITLNTKFSVE